MGGPLTLLAALWALEAARAQALRIGAFNIQSFGDSKVSDPGCCGVIAQILAGYDVMLVQEVRDPDLSAVSALIEQINSVSKHEYSFVSSEPLGRDQYKEMYLFVYRKDTVSVVDTYQYPDAEDAFSREPFVVKFSAPGSAAKEFVLIPLHAAPHHAVAEIDALYDVYLDVIDKWGTDDILFLGDFNADCKYVRAQDWPVIRLRSSEVFKWLIPDSADTTVGNSDCAYDRIVVCGSHLRKSLKHQSATVHDFQEEFGLDQTQASAGAGAGQGARAVLDPDPNLRGSGTPLLALAFLEKALRGSGLAKWSKAGVAVQEALLSLEWGPETVLPAHPQATPGVHVNTSPQMQRFVWTPSGPLPGWGAVFRGGA
ncbi:hypothetical protein MG293_018003 [Ovis ammon polii]|uniref:Deoxyribonuclease-1-like 2 n=1 Tax=Ovis ammon polii TaxID=230172 RepID=A0AAD4Y1B3_OVIAM|nr:hypothetical protein MG293_018003 [Ovis ammon polii]KAI4551330.1 hypothetical protein MJT46_017582 [Ovis ammon polii x Ovis aries]